MRKSKIGFLKKIISAIVVLIALLMIPMNVLAANARVTFGSEGYEKENGETFPIGIYVRGDSDVAEYFVQVKYDSKRLKYVSGAEEVDEENGILTFIGNAEGGVEAKLWLELQSISGGEASVEVINATAKNSLGEEYDFTELMSVKVVISGEDTAAVIEAEEEAAKEAEEQAAKEAEEKVLEEPEEKSAEEAKLSNEKEPEEINEENRSDASIQAEVVVDEPKTVRGGITSFITLHKKLIISGCAILAIFLIAGIAATIVIGGKKKDGRKSNIRDYEDREENIEKSKSEKSEYVFSESDDIEMVSLDSEEFKAENDDISQVTDGASDDTEFGLSNEELEYLMDAEAIEENSETSKDLSVDNENKVQTVAEESIKETVEIAAKDGDESQKTASDNGEKKDGETKLAEATINLPAPKQDLGSPIISVQDVTMKFKISTSNVSGIKEYIIQKIRRKISYRELLALDHISFDIFKGEVVGIIGTNGSGKSTMLRIISGALKPSSGKVVVDRRKIQLLTLGAGFDTELSARENVYLNGAIIGYSKDFIDKNYDKIVEFAELDGFMEEKVKNFSSGMVSRLGFSIATAGDAAEILILDEVLSVGDEFFRKKSLKRVKEMIHGGSTVIMVSHGMATILDNCSKVVWIEKGKLRMIGEPKEVCDAYRKLEQSVQ